MDTVLTERQRQVLDVIREHIDRLGVAPSIQELARSLGIRGPTAQQHLKALERKGFIALLPGRARGIRLLREVDQDGAARTREVPVLGRVAAGEPLFAAENIESTVHVDAAQYPVGQLFALRVHGDSMTGAGIFDGDLVIVRPQPVAEPGDIVVALVAGEDATVKRFRPHGDEVRLEPENPAYGPIVRHARDVAVRGKVVGVQRVMG